MTADDRPQTTAARVRRVVRAGLEPVFWLCAGFGALAAVAAPSGAWPLTGGGETFYWPPAGPVKVSVAPAAWASDGPAAAWHRAAVEVELLGGALTPEEADVAEGGDVVPVDLPAAGVAVRHVTAAPYLWREWPWDWDADFDFDAMTAAEVAAHDREWQPRLVRVVTISLWAALLPAVLGCWAVRLWRRGRPVGRAGAFGRLFRPWAWTAAALGAAVLVPAVVWPDGRAEGTLVETAFARGPRAAPHPRAFIVVLERPHAPAGPDDRPGAVSATDLWDPAGVWVDRFRLFRSSVGGLGGLGGGGFGGGDRPNRAGVRLAVSLWWLLVPAAAANAATLPRRRRVVRGDAP